MPERLNLCEILKGHEGEIFYSPAFGKIQLKEISHNSIDFLPSSNDEIINVDERGVFLDGGECCVFPSKDQRDWLKWDKESNPKIPKTWSELKDAYKTESKCAKITIEGGAVSEIVGKSPIEKSALALLKIHQLIEVGYGGNVLLNEYNGRNTFWTILFDGITREFNVRHNGVSRHLVSFHTKEQAEEFLKHPENVQLLRDYYMI